VPILADFPFISLMNFYNILQSGAMAQRLNTEKLAASDNDPIKKKKKNNNFLMSFSWNCSVHKYYGTLLSTF
jgi:hypothetical protein